jgi:hypothetical protein
VNTELAADAGICIFFFSFFQRKVREKQARSRKENEKEKRKEKKRGF